MAAGAVSRMGTVQYALIYLPFVGLGLLAAEGEPLSLFLLGYIDLGDEVIFGTLTALTFVGAAINYQINFAIYGPEGPRSNPKHSATASYHTFASYLISNPKPVPRTLDEFLDRISNSLSKIKGNWFLYVYLPSRFLFVAIPGVTYLAVEYSLLIGLSFRLFAMEISTVGFAILFGLAVKKIQSRISPRFQSPVGKETGEWFMVPESRKAERLYQEDELELRYAPDGWSFTSFIEDSIPDLEEEEEGGGTDELVFVPLPEDEGQSDADDQDEKHS